MSSKEYEEENTRRTEEEEKLLHPLEIHDEIAFDNIKTLRLDYLVEEANSPIPRCQDLPPHAFGTLTGRSILVSISHGWFFETHPDPHGLRLDLLKNIYAPHLRNKYPHTDIQFFYDFVSMPQRPRNSQEEETYFEGIRSMDSVYIYSDVILFLHSALPDLDMTTRTVTIDMSKYVFHDFLDTVRVEKTTSKTGPQIRDVILTCNDLRVTSSSQIVKYSGEHTIRYLHRPYGQPNTAADLTHAPKIPHKNPSTYAST